MPGVAMMTPGAGGTLLVSAGDQGHNYSDCRQNSSNFSSLHPVLGY